MILKSNLTYEKVAGLPYLGLLPKYLRSKLNTLSDLRDRADFVGFRIGAKWFTLINHPETVQEIMALPYKFQKNININLLTGDGVLTSNGEKWYQDRKILQQFFIQQDIEFKKEIIEKSICSVLNNRSFDPIIDFKKLAAELTFKVIAISLFGEIDSLKVDPLVRNTFDAISKFISKTPYLPNWYTNFFLQSQKNNFENNIKILKDHILNLVRDFKNQKNPSSKNILNCFLHHPNYETEATQQIITMILAGYDTTSLTLCWALFLLSTRPKMQEEILHDDQLLERVLKEVMRLYPAGWAWTRDAVEDVELSHVKFLKGSKVFISPLLMHRDPRFYDNPSEFIPDRFLHFVNHKAYFPFGSGARICLGKSFAMLELKIMLKSLLTNWIIGPTDSEPIMDPQITLEGSGFFFTAQRR